MGRKKNKKPKTLAPSTNNQPKVKKRLGKKRKRISSPNVVINPMDVGASNSNPLVSSGGDGAGGGASVLGISESDVLGKRQYYESLELPGFIFMCNSKTKFDCYRYRVFGLPKGQIEVVKKIERGAMLFLFDTELKLLYGIYEATSGGDLRLEPNAFDGRFPAQVKFHIVKDCLPLHERDFKQIIRENYSGNKFKQELSSTQVINLILLFRPISSGLSASADATFRDVAMPKLLHTRVLDEHSPLPTRHPHPRDSYLSGSQYHPALTRLDHQSVHLAPHGHHHLETHGVYLEPSAEPRHVVQQPAPTHRTSSYYRADAHQPYLPDEPLMSSQGPYRRYGITPQMIQQSRADGYQSGSHTSLFPREQAIGSQPGYVAGHSSQLLSPVAVSHMPSQENSFVQHHTSRQPGSVQAELPTSYQACYGEPTNETTNQTTSLRESNSMASYYYFAGGYPTR